MHTSTLVCEIPKIMITVAIPLTRLVVLDKHLKTFVESKDINSYFLNHTFIFDISM